MKTASNKGINRELTATDSTPSPADFPIGSAASRAAARAKLERLPTAPPLILHLVESREQVLPCDEAHVDDQTNTSASR
jgi:hypothetical protein